MVRSFSRKRSLALGCCRGSAPPSRPRCHAPDRRVAGDGQRGGDGPAVAGVAKRDRLPRLPANPAPLNLLLLSGAFERARESPRRRDAPRPVGTHLCLSVILMPRRFFILASILLPRDSGYTRVQQGSGGDVFPCGDGFARGGRPLRAAALRCPLQWAAVAGAAGNRAPPPDPQCARSAEGPSPTWPQPGGLVGPF